MTEHGETRLGGFDGPGRTFVLALFGGGGVVVGIALPFLARWVAGLPWAPFQGPLRLIADASTGWPVWALPAAGLAAGLAFALFVIHGTPILHVTEEQIRIERRGEITRVIRRDQVEGVRRDGSKLVVESAAGRVLFSGDVEGDKDEIRAALIRHRYPWESA
jgi:hypothetical protein